VKQAHGVERMNSTNPEYALRLQRLSGRRWKKLVPNPYRWNVRRLATGRVLDVGCGIGRCLDFIRPRGVGVDPNTTAVEMCRRHGHEVYTPEEFFGVPTRTEASAFDTLLCAHVLEHLDESAGVELIRAYLPRIATDGRIVLITPQERGQRSDSTHVRFMDAAALTRLVANCGLELERISSFPLPRAFGRWFVYNETVVVARLRSR
jgi:2-polyprenyl-3-methyl-5-hydroxy-6-metoxy-1,4-benzoquinol methylase